MKFLSLRSISFCLPNLSKRHRTFFYIDSTTLISWEYENSTLQNLCNLFKWYTCHILCSPKSQNQQLICVTSSVQIQNSSSKCFASIHNVLKKDCWFLLQNNPDNPTGLKNLTKHFHCFNRTPMLNWTQILHQFTIRCSRNTITLKNYCFNQPLLPFECYKCYRCYLQRFCLSPVIFSTNHKRKIFWFLGAETAPQLKI